jgi:hypothetical protein
MTAKAQEEIGLESRPCVRLGAETGLRPNIAVFSRWSLDCRSFGGSTVASAMGQ